MAMNTITHEATVSTLEQFVATVFEEQDLDEISSYLAEDIVYSTGREELIGPEACRANFAEMLASFDDISIDLEESASEGDWVLCRYVASGTNTGSLTIGEETVIDATNKPATWEGFVSVHFDDGRMDEIHLVADEVGMFTQLGISDELLRVSA